jgi:dolichyl-diphosphooligosaccharide--protein glycosyltransferase
MSSSEEVAYPILRKHDVDYVLVIFGGVLGYSGDDINKFLWMIRIAQGVWPDEVQESSFFTPQGEYRVDDGATETMKKSLMYKMSYYRYAFFLLRLWFRWWLTPLIFFFPPEFRFEDLYGGAQPVDRVRQQKLPKEGPTLDYLGA